MLVSECQCTDISMSIGSRYLVFVQKLLQMIEIESSVMSNDSSSGEEISDLDSCSMRRDSIDPFLRIVSVYFERLGISCLDVERFDLFVICPLHSGGRFSDDTYLDDFSDR